MHNLYTSVKRIAYFPVAGYFRFFANIYLHRWNPTVIVITGSAGKTTQLHLLEAQLGPRARYSHGANSAFGVCFNILGIERSNYSVLEWVKIALITPFRAYRKKLASELYVVEADCDRPGEGKFLGELLRPAYTIWVSSDRTHSMNFSELQHAQNLPSVEAAIALSYGELVRCTTKQVLLLSPNELMQKETTGTIVETLDESGFTNYTLTTQQTSFSWNTKNYTLPAVVPRGIVVSALSALWVMEQLGLQESEDSKFSRFSLPPGRSSIFKGMKDTTIIDSSYNNNIISTKIMLQLLKEYPGDKKWAVMGDMVEQGDVEEVEHQRLADLLMDQNLSQLILYGRRTKRYTLPELEAHGYSGPVVSFEKPQEVIKFLKEKLAGNEVILFKGAGFLEGVIERILNDPNDAQYLCRREPRWQKQRAKWGL